MVVLIRSRGFGRREAQRTHRHGGEGCVTKEAEPGVAQLEAQKHQGQLVAAVRQEEAGKDPFREPPE